MKRASFKRFYRKGYHTHIQLVLYKVVSEKKKNRICSNCFCCFAPWFKTKDTKKKNRKEKLGTNAALYPL